MSALSRLSMAALLVALAAVPTRAQAANRGAHTLDNTAIPARPKLDPGADSNSAQANYAYGI